MPIRINLLAEAQAEEELRRKDPVKRSMYGAVALVSLVVFWCVIQQFKIIAANSELNKYTAQWQEIEADHQAAVSRRTLLNQTENKLESLEMLRTNRFLWGNALNAIQQTVGGLAHIQVVQLRSEQVYDVVPRIPPQTNGLSRVPGTPAKSTSTMSISLEAIDYNEQPGSEVTKFKQAILGVPYFNEHLRGTNGVLLTSLSPPHMEGGVGRPFVKFTLKCVFPDKVR